MYEELIKALRRLGDWSIMDFEDNPSYANHIAKEAADAIEELSRKVENLEAMREISPEAEYAIDKHADNLISHMEELISGLKDKPRWIPVMERLPDCENGAEIGNVEWISHGRVYAGCFGRGGKYRDTYFRTWTDGTEGIDAKDADYWRPIQIPEPPKEEA